MPEEPVAVERASPRVAAGWRVVTCVQMPDIIRHLEALPTVDRSRRFGHAIRSSALRDYVQRIDLARDRALGVFDSDQVLIGFTHVAVDQANYGAELGISVLPEHRRQGIGEAMLLQAIKQAADLDLATVWVYLSHENYPMLELALKAGFIVISRGGEALASRQIASSVRQSPPLLALDT